MYPGVGSELTEKVLACMDTEVPIKIEFDELLIPTAYRADVIVEERVLLELKAADCLLGIHCAQARTYLKHSAAEAALLINFNVKRLSEGIRRFDRRNAWNGMPNSSPRTP